MSLVEQELLTLPEHLSLPPVLVGFGVTRSLVLYVQNVCFVDRCLSFCTFPFGHCVVCSSSIYGFGLTLWCLQTLLTIKWQMWNDKKTNKKWYKTHCHISAGYFLLFVYICIVFGDPIIKKEVRISLTGCHWRSN